MSLASQIFACMAVPATLLLLIQTIMMFFGFGEDVPDDMPDIPNGDELIPDGADVSGLDGLRIFTLRGIIAFFVVFGWVGVVMDGIGCPLYVTLSVAAVCGFAMMFTLALLFRAILKLRNDGNTDNRNAIGVSGKVQLTIIER